MQPANLDQMRQQLAEQHDSLSRRLKEVSRYVSTNPQSIAIDTAAVVADKAGVHASTLVRFANQFEFSGFTELQKLYKNHLHQNFNHLGDYGARIRTRQQTDADQSEVTPTRLLSEFSEANIQALQQTRDHTDPTLLDRAVELMDRASVIYLCGVQRAFPVTMYLAYALGHLKVNCRAVTGIGLMHDDQLSTITNGDVLVAVTFSPYAEATRDMIQTASDHGAQIILIAGDKQCPSAALADCLFTVHEADVRSFRSLSATLCLAQTLCIALGYRRDHQTDALSDLNI